MGNGLHTHRTAEIAVGVEQHIILPTFAINQGLYLIDILRPLGMALQNIPESAVVSAPLSNMGVSKFKSFLLGSATGLVQPIAAIVTMLLVNGTMPIFPAILAFAGGAMMYVIVEEIIPEGQSGKHSNIATIGVALGFALMMILDGTL